MSIERGIMLLQKELTDKTKAWNKIFQSFKNNGTNVQTWSLSRGNGCYFHVDISGNKLIIKISNEKTPSCKITNDRTVDFQQFEFVANYYNSYIKGIKGIREKIRDGCQNSSYIISLITRFL